MDYRKNIKYFTSSDTLFYIGIPILAAGTLLVICYLFWFFFVPHQMAIGLVLALIGAALAFIPRTMRSSEKDIDAIISSVTDGYVEEVTEKFDLEKLIIKNITPTVIDSYIYDEKDLLMRRGKDDRKYRTSKYSAAAVICTKNGMLISHKTFSLIDERVSENTYEFMFSSLDSVAVIDEEIKQEDGNKIKTARFVITENGKEVLSLPTTHVVAIDRLCEDINRMISSFKNR